ncbi:MAG: hypothetical protein ACI9VR_000771 [Cognaticolwellia sp.]|jgi:hypothetical protein
MKDIESHIHGALLRSATQETTLINGLIDDLGQLERLDASGLDPILRGLITQRRSELQQALAQQLVRWRTMGGSLNLSAAPLSSPSHALHAVPDQPTPGWGDTLAELLIVGRHHVGYNDELEAIGAVVEGVSKWPELPRKSQATLIEWLTARLRNLQHSGQERDWRVEQAFSALTRYSRVEKPGFCYGLARDHLARDESWAADAVALRERLREQLGAGEAGPGASQQLLSGLQELAKELDVAPEAAKEAVQSQFLTALHSALDQGLTARDPLLLALTAPHLESLDGAPFKALRRAILDQMDHRI